MNLYNRESRSAGDPEGRYADRFKIGYRSCVFILDFEQSFYEDEKEHAHTRIITSPEDLRSFLELLQKTMEQYEQIYGPISTENKEGPVDADSEKDHWAFLK